MKINLLGEIIISIILIGILIFFLNPLELSMPESVHSLMIPFLIVVFIALATVFWKETPGDERSELHKLISSRFAYFASVSMLLLAIVIESFQKALDPWLIITLCVVLLAKILGLIYGYVKH